MFTCIPINKEWKAIVYTGFNLDLVKELVGEPLNQLVKEFKGCNNKYLIIPTILGSETIHEDDVILKNIDGNIIAMTYDEYNLIFKSNVDAG